MKRLLVVVLCTSATIGAQSSGRITGRVRGAGGHPLRAEVLAVTAEGGVRMNPCITDDQGNFTVNVPGGRALLVARADGYVSEEQDIVVRPWAGATPVQFVLSPAGPVSGRVFDENGAGVPGARVWVAYRGERRAWRVAEEAGGEPADAFGYFTVPVVAQGRPFVLHAESDERLLSSSGTLVLRGPEMAGVILLLSRRGAVVRGRVLEETGGPAAGVTVSLRALPGEGEFTAEQRASVGYARSAHKSVVSGADGSFVFAGVPPGRAVVTAQARGRRAAAEADTVTGRDSELVLMLK
jgi:hypothetical protein